MKIVGQYNHYILLSNEYAPLRILTLRKPIQATRKVRFKYLNRRELQNFIRDQLLFFSLHNVIDIHFVIYYTT